MHTILLQRGALLRPLREACQGRHVLSHVIPSFKNRQVLWWRIMDWGPIPENASLNLLLSNLQENPVLGLGLSLLDCPYSWSAGDKTLVVSMALEWEASPQGHLLSKRGGPGDHVPVSEMTASVTSSTWEVWLPLKTKKRKTTCCT